MGKDFRFNKQDLEDERVQTFYKQENNKRRRKTEQKRHEESRAKRFSE